MADRNYVLLVAGYGDDTSAAADDFKTIKGLDDTAVVAAVVLSRDSDGKVEVKEHGGGLVAGGTALGAVGGLVVGLFAPPLLLAGAVGAGIGAGVGAIAKRHEEKEIGVDAEEWLPNGSSAIVAVVDDLYLDRVEKAVDKAAKKVSKAIDSDDYDAVVKAVNEGDEKIKDFDDKAVVAAVVLSRDSAGKVEVKEHGGGLVAGGTALGAVGGLVVGLFAPPLLLASVVGAGIGAGVGALAKRHEEKEIGVDAEEWLPPGSSAIVAVVDDLYLDRVDKAVEKASKKVSKAVDKDDYDAVVKAVNEGDEKIIEAAES